LRADATVSRVIAAWRRLTGGRAVRDSERSTLLACSGGPDSAALVLSIAAAVVPERDHRAEQQRSGPLHIAYVLHDMRSPEAGARDCGIAQKLAEDLGVQFHAGRALAGEAGEIKSEATYRRLRYRALAELAGTFDCKYVATGHHANDQLETVLARFIRGAGPAALAGMRESRRLESVGGPLLIRPMLTVTRDEARQICGLAGLIVAEDETNLDQTHLRSALRHRVVPPLIELAPHMAGRIETTLTLLRASGELLNEAGTQLLNLATITADGSAQWQRSALASSNPAIIAQAFLTLRRLLLGAACESPVRSRAFLRAASLCVDDERKPRQTTIAGLRVIISSRSVVVQRAKN